jgi:hypothetical protein
MPTRPKYINHSTAGPKIQGCVQVLLEAWVDEKGTDMSIDAVQAFIHTHDLKQSWRQIRKWIGNRTHEVSPEKRKLYEQNRKQAFQALSSDRQEKIMKQRKESSTRSRERRKMIKGFLDVANIDDLNMLSRTACSLDSLGPVSKPKHDNTIKTKQSVDEMSLLATSLWTDASDSGV